MAENGAIASLPGGALLNQAALANLIERGALAVLFDLDLRVISSTPAMRQLLVPEPGAASGALFAALPQSWREACCLALREEETQLPRTSLTGPDGLARIISATVRPWRASAQSKVAGVSVYCQDETRLAELERDAEVARETLRIATNAAYAGIWRLDLETRSVWVSPEYEQIIGTHLSFEDLTSYTPAWLYAEDLPRYQQFLRELAGPAGHASLEHRLAKDPRIWIHATCQKVVGGAGTPRAFVGMARNITERKQAELELMDATRRAARALRDKRAMLNEILKDLGLSGELDGEEAHDEPPSHASGVAELTTQFLRMTKELDARDASLAKAVDALRASRVEAQQASAAKTRFLAAMTHELRTPLNAVIGYSELLLEDAEACGDDAIAADQRRVVASARALFEMVDAILDLTKLEAAEFALASERFDPARAVLEAAEEIRAKAGANGNTLAVDVDALGFATGDEQRVKQCLRHLLSNACKFTRDGKVALRARREPWPDGDRLIFEISDTGTGIEPQRLSRLFEPFALADPSMSKANGSAGLGLALTRGMARLMGGDLTARSEPSRGSVFVLEIAADAPASNAMAGA